MRYLVIPSLIIVDGKEVRPIFYAHEMPPREFVFETPEAAKAKMDCMRVLQPDVDWTYIPETVASES